MDSVREMLGPGDPGTPGPGATHQQSPSGGIKVLTEPVY